MKKFVCMFLALVMMVALASTAFAGDCGDTDNMATTGDSGVSLVHYELTRDDEVTFYYSNGNIETFLVADRICGDYWNLLDWKEYGWHATMVKEMVENPNQVLVLEINGVKVQLQYNASKKVFTLTIGNKNLKSVRNNDTAAYNGFTYFSQDEFLTFIEKNLPGVEYPNRLHCPYGYTSISRLIIWLTSLTDDHNGANILLDYMVKYPCTPVLFDYVKVDYVGKFDENGNVVVAAHTGNYAQMYTLFSDSQRSIDEVHDRICQSGHEVEGDLYPETKMNYAFAF